MNERFFLIDCGEGTQIQLRRNRLSAARINHIFISHLHGDHLFGIFGLMSSLGLMGRTAILNLYGPKALEEIIETHLGFFGPLPYDVQYHVCKHNSVVYEDKKNEVIPVRLKHRTETFGYLFREKRRSLNVIKGKIREYNLGIEDIKNVKSGKDYITENGTKIPNSELTLPPIHSRSYAFISDTAYMPGVAELLKGVDILYHEATFLEKDKDLAEQTFHSTVSQAARVAKDADAGKLLIGHFSTRYKAEDSFVKEATEIFPDVVAVNDGDRFSLELSREIR